MSKEEKLAKDRVRKQNARKNSEIKETESARKKAKISMMTKEQKRAETAKNTAARGIARTKMTEEEKRDEREKNKLQKKIAREKCEKEKQPEISLNIKEFSADYGELSNPDHDYKANMLLACEMR
jgi:hypothetical protein